MLFNRDECVQKLRNVSRQITEINKNKEIKSNTLANARGEYIEELNQQIEHLINEKRQLVDEKTRAQETITAIDRILTLKLCLMKTF